MQKLKIEATVRVFETPPGKKLKFVTEATIWLGKEAVAEASLGGRWNSAQALAEFKKNPKRFKPLTVTPDTLTVYASAA